MIGYNDQEIEDLKTRISSLIGCYNRREFPADYAELQEIKDRAEHFGEKALTSMHNFPYLKDSEFKVLEFKESLMSKIILHDEKLFSRVGVEDLNLSSLFLLSDVSHVNGAIIQPDFNHRLVELKNISLKDDSLMNAVFNGKPEVFTAGAAPYRVSLYEKNYQEKPNHPQDIRNLPKSKYQMAMKARQPEKDSLLECSVTNCFLTKSLGKSTFHESTLKFFGYRMIKKDLDDRKPIEKALAFLSLFKNIKLDTHDDINMFCKKFRIPFYANPKFKIEVVRFGLLILVQDYVPTKIAFVEGNHRNYSGLSGWAGRIVDDCYPQFFSANANSIPSTSCVFTNATINIIQSEDKARIVKHSDLTLFAGISAEVSEDQAKTNIDGDEYHIKKVLDHVLKRLRSTNPLTKLETYPSDFFRRGVTLKCSKLLFDKDGSFVIVPIQQTPSKGKRKTVVSSGSTTLARERMVEAIIIFLQQHCKSFDSDWLNQVPKDDKREYPERSKTTRKIMERVVSGESTNGCQCEFGSTKQMKGSVSRKIEVVEELVLSCMIDEKYIEEIKRFFEAPTAVEKQSNVVIGNDFKNCEFLWVKVFSIVNKLATLTGTAGIWRFCFIDPLYKTDTLKDNFTSQKKLETTFRTVFLLPILKTIRKYGLMPDVEVKGRKIFMNKEYPINNKAQKFKVETIMDCLLVSYVKKFQKMYDDKDTTDIFQTWVNINGVQPPSVSTLNLTYNPDLYHLGELDFFKYCEDILSGRNAIIDYKGDADKNVEPVHDIFTRFREKAISESMVLREFPKFFGLTVKKQLLEGALNQDEDMDLKCKAKWFSERYGQDKDKDGDIVEDELDIESIEVVENANYVKKLKEDFNIEYHTESQEVLNQDDAMVQDIDPDKAIDDILSEDDETK